MSMDPDQQSHRQDKDDSLADRLNASDFFPPGTGWNTAGNQTSGQPRQDVQATPVSPLEPRQH